MQDFLLLTFFLTFLPLPPLRQPFLSFAGSIITFRDGKFFKDRKALWMNEKIKRLFVHPKLSG
jgi:hypothetical protein